MFLCPIRPDDPPSRKTWDNLTLYHDGAFYAAFNTIRTDAPKWAYALDVAKSVDGVHWEFIARDQVPIEGAHAGYGLLRHAGRTWYYPTVTRPGGDIHIKVYSTCDYLNWEHHEEADIRPDRQYYAQRWEEVCLLADEEAGERVYYGYVSSEVRADVGEASLGIIRSRDALHWEVLPPPVIQWGEIPPQHMEVCFCEKIGGRYYLGLGGRLYLDSYGFSIYTFVADSPRGPFAPDLPAFRVTGTSRRDVTWLGHSFHTPHGLLFALWQSTGQDPEIPSRNLSIGPLLRLDAQDGHLRLFWWEGNEAAKGTPVELGASSVQWTHPHAEDRVAVDSVQVTESEVHLSASRDGVIAMLGHTFSRAQGFWLEARVEVKERRGTIATHQHAAMAGFLLETVGRDAEGIGEGYAILADTLGVTRGGPLCYANDRITHSDLYAEAGAGLVNHRSGAFRGHLDFVHDDQVGPLGHASYCGIRHGRDHHVRLIGRGDFVLLTVDDRYVQTYRMPKDFTGRIGIICIDGTCRVHDLRAWTLSLGR